MKRVALALVAGCAYPQDEFATDVAAARCTLYEDCEALDAMSWESAAACQEDEAAAWGPDALDCPGYAKGPAKDCVDAVDAMTCEDLLAEAWPDPCESAALCGE